MRLSRLFLNQLIYIFEYSGWVCFCLAKSEHSHMAFKHKNLESIQSMELLLVQPSTSEAGGQLVRDILPEKKLKNLSEILGGV